MPGRHLLTLVLAVALYLAAPVPSRGETPPWLSDILRPPPSSADHPLLGSFANADGTLRRVDELPGHLRADIVLLGELHDNDTHHALRSAVLRSVLSGRQGTALVFEHLRPDQNASLEKLRRAFADGPAPTLEDVRAELDWSRSGWPDAVVSGLLMPALAAGVPILAGDPQRDRVRTVARDGLDALDAIDPAERQRLGLDAPLEPLLQEALLDQLEGSHCGLVPKQAFVNMAAAQRYRDAHQAAALITARRAHGHAVLLAGNGHVRTDRGVPWHLRRMAPEASAVSVMLVEVADGRSDPADYMPRSPDGKPAADILVFTPRAERPDPCVEMRKRMRR